MTARPSFERKPLRLTVLPLRGAVLFPCQTLTVPGLGGLTRAELAHARAGGLRVAVLPVAADSSACGQALGDYGTEAEILRIVRLPDGSVGAVARGLRRVRVVGRTHRGGRVTALVELLEDRATRRSTNEAALARAVRSAAENVQRLRELPGESTRVDSESLEATAFDFRVAALLTLEPEEKFALLTAVDRSRRLKRLLKFLVREEELLKLAKRIRDRVNAGDQESRRVGLLKEQVRILTEELSELEGECGEGLGELDLLAAALADLELPSEAREVVERELGRLAQIAPASPEHAVARSYLEWIRDLPWGRASGADAPPLAKVRRRLDAQHFGLQPVKDRILEYVAVMRHTGASHGQVLLLAGPPGVGKSSLARQIAAALDRPFVQIALGGVRDEAELRGHRRTYVGAMPGKLLHAMRQAKSSAPVILLDELDKVGLDHGRSLLTSALLEVLDYEQNHAFVDHYLGVPYDLSGALFIATANSIAEIPGPLLDRMELVELSSYTEHEKLQIARRHLLPALAAELGLKATQLGPSDQVVKTIIAQYTREAGVRQLSRDLATIGRKTVRALAEGRRPLSFTLTSLQRLLGPPRFADEPNDARLSPGVALGLAYTAVGGDILYIETTRLPAATGKGALTLTGSLGRVMKESAEAAWVYLKGVVHARPELLQVAPALLERSHIHLHFPSGATPKDGPSAGLAIVCALASLLTGRPLAAKLAMTGEITLRGQVLPIGGLKEKLLAAHRYGKTRIIIPAANVHDLVHVPREALRELEIIPVQTMEEALAAAGLTGKTLQIGRPRAAGRPDTSLKIAHYGRSHDLR